jgi:hypothetical protein
VSRRPKFVSNNCILVCDACMTPIKRGGIGYASVDLLAVSERGKDWERGYKKPAVAWRIYHGRPECDPNQGKWNHADYRIWAADIETFDALVLKIADVIEKFDGLCDTNFVGLIRRIIYDSSHYQDKQKAHGEAISVTRKARGLTDSRELTCRTRFWL